MEVRYAQKSTRLERDSTTSSKCCGFGLNRIVVNVFIKIKYCLIWESQRSNLTLFDLIIFIPACRQTIAMQTKPIKTKYAEYFSIKSQDARRRETIEATI